MDDAALFLHLLGVALLVGSVTTTLLTTLRIQASRSVTQLRTLIAGTKRGQVVIIPAILLIIATGLYLVSRHGYHGSIPWGAGWVVTSMVVTGLLAVVGATVEDADDRRLRAAIAHATGEQPDADLREIQRAPRPVYVIFFGTSQVVALLFLMTYRPGAAVSIVACVVAAAASAVTAALRIRSLRRTTLVRSDDLEA